MTDHTSGPTGSDPDAANPFSREGGQPGADAGTGPGESSSASGQPGQSSGATALPPTGGDPAPGSDPYGYPPSSQPAPPPSAAQPYGDPYSQPSATQPYGDPQPYGQPSANPPYEQPGGVSYGQPADPYGQPSTNQPYGQPSANPPYEQPPAYEQQPPAYGSTGYDQTGYGVSPYQGGYGYPAYSAAGVQHPQAVTALITGIIGVLLCGPVGIAGLILGRKVRNEIDADPQRYTGRGLGTAGFILGIVAIAFMVIGALFIVIGYASSS